MSNINTTNPTRSTEPTAPKYEVPYSLEACERFNRSVGKVLDAPKQDERSEVQVSPCTLPVDAEGVKQGIS